MLSAVMMYGISHMSFRVIKTNFDGHLKVSQLLVLFSTWFSALIQEISEIKELQVLF